MNAIKYASETRTVVCELNIDFVLIANFIFSQHCSCFRKQYGWACTVFEQSCLGQQNYRKWNKVQEFGCFPAPSVSVNISLTSLTKCCRD
jgi:hypothetical protein